MPRNYARANWDKSPKAIAWRCAVCGAYAKDVIGGVYNLGQVTCSDACARSRKSARQRARRDAKARGRRSVRR